MKSEPKPVPATQFYKSWKLVPSANWRWPNFSPQEIACRGTGQILVVADALDKLQHLRTKLGRPLILNSAYRSPDHNKAVGGASASRHMKGDAFDVSMSNQNPVEFLAAAKSVGFRGFGFYPAQGFIHIDLGNPREWGDKAKMMQEYVSDSPTPDFKAEPVKAPVPEILLKPEVLVPVGTAIGSSGLMPVLAGNGPVAWAIGGIIVLVAAVGLGIFIFKRREQRSILVD